MPYKTRYGSHYHETYGCCGATEPCGSAAGKTRKKSGRSTIPGGSWTCGPVMRTGSSGRKKKPARFDWQAFLTRFTVRFQTGIPPSRGPNSSRSSAFSAAR